MRESQAVDDTSDTETKPSRKDKGQANVSFGSVDALRSHMRGLTVSIYIYMCCL